MSTQESTPPDPMSPASLTPAQRSLMGAQEPGFQPPPPLPARPADPMDPAATHTREMEDGEAVDPFSTASGPPSSKRTESGRSPASTNEPDLADVLRANAAAFEGLISTGVRVAGTLADARFTPETHAWLPLEHEVAAITEPLARIAARHAPNVGGGDSSDILDGMEAGVASLGYVLRARTDTMTGRPTEQQAAQNNPGRV